MPNHSSVGLHEAVGFMPIVGAGTSAEAQEVLERALSQGYRGITAEALIAGPIDKVAEQFRTFGEIHA
jgi:hypothetical protein